VRYLDESRPLPFCPGCGHSHILPTLDGALEKLGRDPRKVVLVTDIGCVGLSDQYFDTAAMHGLHGRSFTYATGIKLAHPELEVVVMIGDGGCGIGAAHLVHAARRNIGIKVLVFNNFNFGMTGGQHSVTTPAGALTATTRGGNLEAPLDVCATVAPSRPSFVARTSTFHPEFGDLMKQAITAEGFALLDIWELCTAYFGPANHLNKKKMSGWMDALEMPEGVIVRGDRAEYSAAVRAAMPEPTDGELLHGFDVSFDSSLQSRTSVLIAGDAGQRVQSAADTLARAAVASGLYATQKGAYPVTIKTGYSLADLLLSPELIECSDGGVPDLALVVGPEGLARSRGRLQEMGPDSLVLAEESLPEFETGARVERLPLSKAAAKVDRLGLVTVGIGALLERAGLVSAEAFEWAARQRFRDKIADKVVGCAQAGQQLIAGDALPSA